MKRLNYMAAVLCVCVGLFTASVNASVVIGSTRAVYAAGESEITLRLSNEGSRPALVQSWVDNGDVHSAPTNIDVPFTLTPPISRIEPSKAQTLRIVHTGEAMPQGRESVFWLNVLEIPPKPDASQAEANRIQFAFRSRIKLFYRPKGLEGTAAEAPALLTWRLISAGSALSIEAHNPTAFYVSLTEVEVLSGEHGATFDAGGMLAPGETQRFSLEGSLPATADARVRYTSLNDYGGAVTAETPLAP